MMLPPVSLPIEKPDEPRCCRRAGARARARCAFLEQPRVHRLAAEPDVVERERAQAQLGDEDGAGLVQSANDRGVGSRHAVPEWLRSVGRRDARRVEQVLDAVRNAVKRATILPRRNFRVRLLRLRERHVLRERDDAAELRIELLDPAQVDVRQPLGGERLLLDPARQSGHGRERDISVARGQRHAGARAAYEPVERRARAVAGEHGVPARRGSHVRVDGDLARPHATFEERRHRPAPALRSHLALGRAHRDLGELLCLGKGGRRHRGP